MQHFTLNTARVITSDQISLLSIEISEELTEGTDWTFNHNSTSNSLTGSFANYSRLTVESGDHDAGDTYLVLGYGRMNPSSLTEQYESRLVRSGEADSTEPTYSMEGEDTSENLIQFHARTFDLGASDNTFTIQTRSDGGGSGTHEHSGLFALNLEKFVDSNEIYTEADVNLGTVDWATLFQTLNLTPSQTGNVTILANTMGDYGDAAMRIQARLQVDNSDEPTGQSQQTTQQIQHDNDDQYGHIHFTVESLDDTEHTFDFEGDSNSASGTPHVQSRQLVAFSMELAAGDNCDPLCTQNVNDGIIIGDSLITLTLFNQTDGVIIGDSVTLTLVGSSQTNQNDGIVIGDSVTLEITCNVTCTLNLGDGLIIGDLVTPSGVTPSAPTSFNALYLRVNPNVQIWWMGQIGSHTMTSGQFFNIGLQQGSTNEETRSMPAPWNMTITDLTFDPVGTGDAPGDQRFILRKNGANTTCILIIANTGGAPPIHHTCNPQIEYDY